MRFIIFSISGYILDEQNKGLESIVFLDGDDFNPYCQTDSSGYFKFEIKNKYFSEILTRHILIIKIKGNDGKLYKKMEYEFNFFPNTNLKVKLYPYSQKAK